MKSPVTVLAYEEVRRHAGTSAAHVYGGLVSAFTALCEEREVPYQGQPVGTVKKLATGKGNASKAAMIAAAEERWSVACEEDEADALWVADALRSALGGAADYYIGLDPGQACGWAVLGRNGKRLASGVWDLKSRRHEGGGMRYVRARSHLSDLLDAFADRPATGPESPRPCRDLVRGRR